MASYADFQLNSGQYVPQYAGSPLAALNDTGEELSKRHYAGLADMSALELMGQQLKNEAVSDSAKEVVAGHVKQVQDALADLTKNGAENSTAKIMAMKNAFMGNEDLLAIKSLSGNYKKFLEDKSKRTTPIYNTKKEQEILNSPVRDPETGKLSAVYSQPFDLPVAEKLDWLGQQDAVLDPLKPDSFQTDLMKAKPTGMSNADFLQSNTYQQLSRKKVNNYLFGNEEGTIKTDAQGNIQGAGWGNYKNTAAYKQQHDVMGMSDEEIADDLRGRGMSRVFSNVQKEFKDVTPPAGKTDNVSPYGVEYGPGVAVESTWGYNPDAFDPNVKSGATVATIQATPSFSGKDEAADKQIKEYQDAGFIVEPIVGGGTGGGAISGYNVRKGDNADFAKIPAYQKYLADVTTAAEVYDPSFAKMTPAEKENYMKSPQARKNLDAYMGDVKLRLANNPLYTPLDPTAIADETKFVKNQIAHRTIFDPESGQEMQVTDKEGMTTDRFQKAMKGYDISKMEVTGKYAPLNFQTLKLGNDFAEGIEARIPHADDPNKFKTVVLTPSVGELESLPGKVNSVKNQLYRTLATKPGAWHNLDLQIRNGGAYVPLSSTTKVAPETQTRLNKQGISTRSLKARELYGNQKAAFLQYAQGQGMNVPADVDIIQVEMPDGSKKTVIGYDNLTYDVLGINPQQ